MTTIGIRIHALSVLGLLAIATVCYAGVRVKASVFKGAPTDVPAHDKPVCMLESALPPEYVFTKLAKISAEKDSYGEVEEVLVVIANEARRIGADAIINVRAKNQFQGLLPWKVTAPNGHGIAVKLAVDAPPIDCVALAGKLR